MQLEIPEDINNLRNIFVSVVGSVAQNASDNRSDIDYHFCFIEPTSERLSILNKNVNAITSEDRRATDYAGHEIEKMLLMLLKSNCNALEDIYTPITIYKHPHYYDGLKEIADMCITKKMYACYSGVAVGVKKRILTETYDERDFKKHHRNMFRNLFTGIHALEEGEIIMDYEVLKQMFDFENPDYEKWERDYNSYMYDLEWAMKYSDLPDDAHNDVRKLANDYLIDIRRNNW